MDIDDFDVMDLLSISKEEFQYYDSVHENEYLKRKVDQLKLENDQLKRTVNQWKDDYDLLQRENYLRYSSLMEEMSMLNAGIGVVFMPVERNISSKNSGLPTFSNTRSIAVFLNSLPDDCLRLIMIRLPLQKRVSLRAVSHRWKAVIESMCRSVHKISLSEVSYKIGFFQSLENQKNLQKEKNILMLDQNGVSENVTFVEGITGTDFIASLFPNVSQLVLNLPLSVQFTSLRMLENFAYQLRSLTLDISVSNCLSSFIWDKITKMPKLESIIFYGFPPENGCDFSFIRQLRTLKLKAPARDINLPKLFAKIRPNMRHLELNVFGYGDLHDAIEANSASFCGVTHAMLNIVYHDSNLSYRLHSVICRYFVSLVELDLPFGFRLSLKEQLPAISQLKHLTKLHLYLNDLNLNYDLPEVRLNLLQYLVLNFRFTASSLLAPNAKSISYRIIALFNQIPRMFPGLKNLDFCVDTVRNIPMMDQLFSQSILLLKRSQVKCQVLSY